jgi:tRNA(fMet)-specific endonuclease VapC
MDWVLLDTNVVLYLLPSRPHPNALLYRQHVEGRSSAISFVTVGELYVLAVRNKWGPTRVFELEAHLRSSVVVPYDVSICKAYARLKTQLRTSLGSSRVIESNDLWIAACAVRHEVPLVTHNRRHFEGIPGLTIISEAPRFSKRLAPDSSA